MAYPDNGAKVDHVTMLATSWSLFGAAVLFFIARLGIRFHFSKRLFWDDAWAFFAILCLLANAVLTHVMLHPMYVTISVQQQFTYASIKRSETSGLVPRDLNAMFASITQFLKFQFAESMIFWTCLWSVKASFLAFFKRLTTNVKGHYLAWWVIVIITVLAYIGCAITYPVSCSDFSPTGCTKPHNVRLALLSLRFSTCVDIITDLMIIALPMSLAWRVKLPWKPRLALFGVFSLGGVIIVFAIMRVAFVNKEHRQPEISWLNFWSAIEAGVACVVCNLAPFKILFPGRVRNYSSNPYSFGRRYARDEKPPAESHELSLSSHGGKMAQSKVSGPLEPRGFPPHPATTPVQLSGRERYKSLHLPRGVQKSFLRVSIGPDLRSQINAQTHDGILVTQEVETKVVGPDQITVSSEALAQERADLRTTWIARESDESLDRLPPRAPGIKAFA